MHDAAVLQFRTTTGLIGEKVRKTVRTLWQSVTGRLNHEQGFPRHGSEAVTAIAVTANDMHAIGYRDTRQTAFAGIENAVAVGIDEYPAIADGRQ